MKIIAVAGMAPITKDPGASRKLYRDVLGLPRLLSPEGVLIGLSYAPHLHA